LSPKAVQAPSFQMLVRKVAVRRRDFLALGLAAFSSACHRRKGTGYPGYALIATAGEQALAVVDLNAFVLRDSIALNGYPSAVLPAPTGGASYTLTPRNGTVHLIDARLQVARHNRLADEISELRIATDGRSLLAITPSTTELIQADTATLKVMRRHKLSSMPTSMDVPATPKAGEAERPPFVAVVGAESGTVELFDLSTGKRWGTKFDARLGQIRFRFDGKLLLLANLIDRVLLVLNVPDLRVISELSLAMEPQNMCFSTDGGQLFVSGDGMDAVAIVFPYNTLEVDQTVLAGHDPGIMVCSETPGYLFVASHSGSDISILDIDSRKVIGLVGVGGQPRYMAVTPDSQYALILDEGSGDLAVIHISSIRANREKSGAGLFTVLPVGSKPVHAAVVTRA
jgi:WD40 repeat protein